MAKNLSFQPIRINQSNKDKGVYLASIKVSDLINESQFDIDYWNPAKKNSKEQGYQRHATEVHLKKIANYATNDKDAVFPTSLLVNCRGKADFAESGNNVGMLTIQHPPFWIIDGQHRVKGLKHAIEELGDDSWADKELPVVFLTNFNRLEEINQFVILNSTQKRIVTDLAQRLLVDTYEMGGKELKDKIFDDRKFWEIRAVKLVDLLNERSDSPWYKMIQLPNTQKLASNIIRQNSFVKSMQPLLRDGYLSTLRDLDKNYEIMRNYWNAIKRIFPKAFLEPRDYVIQKTPGIFSLHSLAHTITLRGLPEYSEDTFYRILKNVFSENDDYYWQKDNVMDGAARAGSMKGFSRLAEDFKSKLE